MVRKTIAQLTGIDPEYSKQFVNDGQQTEQPTPANPEAPKAQKAKKPPKPDTPRKVKEPATASRQSAQNSRKQVNLMLYPLVRHSADLEHLTARGIPGSDVVKLAGRRALATFEPKAVFTELADGDRLPTKHAYKTNKTVDTAVMDKMRTKTDPLNLRGDGFLLRGQIEPIFWKELDAVILEMKDRFPDEPE